MWVGIIQKECSTGKGAFSMGYLVLAIKIGNIQDAEVRLIQMI